MRSFTLHHNNLSQIIYEKSKMGEPSTSWIFLGIFFCWKRKMCVLAPWGFATWTTCPDFHFEKTGEKEFWQCITCDEIITDFTTKAVNVFVYAYQRRHSNSDTAAKGYKVKTCTGDSLHIFTEWNLWQPFTYCSSEKNFLGILHFKIWMMI